MNYSDISQHSLCHRASPVKSCGILLEQSSTTFAVNIKDIQISEKNATVCLNYVIVVTATIVVEK